MCVCVRAARGAILSTKHVLVGRSACTKPQHRSYILHSYKTVQTARTFACITHTHTPIQYMVLNIRSAREYYYTWKCVCVRTRHLMRLFYKGAHAHILCNTVHTPKTHAHTAATLSPPSAHARARDRCLCSSWWTVGGGVVNCFTGAVASRVSIMFPHTVQCIYMHTRTHAGPPARHSGGWGVDGDAAAAVAATRGVGASDLV